MATYDRAGIAQTILVSVATLVAIALLGWVLAYWTWVWFAPRPEARAYAVSEPDGRMTSAAGLFGNAQRAGKAVVPVGVAIKLLGVVAASRGVRSYAVVQTDANQILLVREGENVAPAILLREVHADHVVLERGGMRETLAWPQRNPTAESSVRQVGK